MSKENKPMYRTLNVAIVSLLLVGLCLSIYITFTPYANIFKLIQRISYIFIFVIGLFYALYGYKKDAAKYYKIYMAIFSLITILHVSNDLLMTKTGSYGSNISGVLRTVICVITLILTFAKDLGKSTSMSLAYAMLIVGIINSGRLLIVYNDSLAIMLSAINNLLTVLVAFLFVIEKYIDKEDRGTK